MNIKTKIPQDMRSLLKTIGRIADKNNIRAYAVGGFVRDIILGRQSLDIDITVEGDAIKLAKEFARLYGKTIKAHKQFGTATVSLRDSRIDLATSRKELYKKPASYPKVAPGSIRDDLFRRDFTINALAMSLNKGSFGKLIDFFGGLDDLKNKKIRVLHDKSFIDDPSRCFRAVRFEQRFDFAIENATLNLIRDCLSKDMLCLLNRTRIKKELCLIAQEAHPLKCIKRLCEFIRCSSA